MARKIRDSRLESRSARLRLPMVYRANQWFLAEVKSWRDKLNDNQKRWIEDNHRYLHLPFKLVQVHRMESMSAPPA
jgi:hypothetical protein